MRLKYALLMLFVSLFSLSCSSASKGRVVETESGVLEAIGLAKNEPDARIAAVDQAIEFCSQQRQKPVFRNDQLRSGTPHKSFDLDLKNIPVIGKVFKGEDKSQVILAFRCNARSV